MSILQTDSERESEGEEMSGIIGFLIGMIVGGTTGFLITAVLYAGSRHEK